MIKPRWMLFAAVFGFAYIATARAQDIQVNAYTTDGQNSPSVGLGGNGVAVVVWESDGSSGTDTSLSSIQGQLYASDGSTMGGEFQVNTYTTSGQFSPSVAIGADGAFVVVWNSPFSAYNINSIQAQRFASDGSTIGDQLQVTSIVTQEQTNPVVELQPDGDFVVAWENYNPNYDYKDIHLQRLASDGSRLGVEFRINSYTRHDQRNPSLAVAGTGDFVVVWDSYGSYDTDVCAYSIRGRRFASDGSFAGGEFQINTYTTNNQKHPSVGSDEDGNFVVVWQSESGDPGYCYRRIPRSHGPSPARGPSVFGVQGQRFASDGSFVGGEIQVNSYATSSENQPPSVAVETDGDFIVVWSSDGSTGNDTLSTAIQARSFASDGSATSGQFQVNTYTTGGQGGVAIEGTAVGKFVAVWTSTGGSGGSDTSGSSVQRTPAGRILTIFTDGFESGDLSAWASTVP